ncbi:MAG TPA: hypothetical protein VEY91_05105 [Candidatus Limnocylindria bacterium]|nr:hypothetical protein [Candidatus Limnocylindria bacterium]
MRWRGGGGLLLLFLASVSEAQSVVRSVRLPLDLVPPALHPGAVEVGASLSTTTIEGQTRVALGLRAGSFTGIGDGLVGYEAGVGYSRLPGLDVLDLEGAVTWQRMLGASGFQPFLAIAGGMRQEWLGSFRQARVLVGAGVGVRTLASHRAALRAEYRLRRIMNDPVADFTEHQIWASLSLLFRNRPPSSR